MALLWAVATVLLGTALCSIVRYDGHKVIQVQAVNQDQLRALQDIYENELLDFWTPPSLRIPTDIRVEPEQLLPLLNKLNSIGLNVTIVHEDVQKLIENAGQHPHTKDKRQFNIATTTVIGGFPRFDVINAWMEQQKVENPAIVQTYSIGQTYERRNMVVIKVGTLNANKPVIWIDSGIHAREWLSVATSLNIIDILIKGYRAQDPVITALLTHFDWHFLPTANPDGYEYTFTSGGRMWRKTRTPYIASFGADPNRNWGIAWGSKGVSHNVMRDDYCGPSEWSEKCVVNMRTILTQLAPRMKVYMSLHTYGQMWFVPYAYDRTAFPTDYARLTQIAKEAVQAIKQKSGQTYSVGRVPDLLYEASGSSVDWVKAYLQTPFAFGMELRPTQNVADGFIASATQIRPTSEELWAGLQVVARYAAQI